MVVKIVTEIVLIPIVTKCPSKIIIVNLSCSINNQDQSRSGCNWHRGQDAHALGLATGLMETCIALYKESPSGLYG